MSTLREFTDAQSFKICTKALRHIDQKEFVEAKKILEEGLAEFNQDSPLYFYHGVVLAALGEYDKSIESFQHVINLKSKFTPSAKKNIEKVILTKDFVSR